MGIFDFLSPEVDNAGMAQQNKLLQQGQDFLNSTYNQGRGDLKAAAKKARPAYQQSVDLFSNLSNQYKPGFDMYINSLGLNGQEGYNSAVNAYQAGPELDLANQNFLRNQSALGNIRSGASAAGLQQLGAQNFSKWQDRLAGFDLMRPYEQQANALTNLGQFEYGFGKDKANLGASYAPAIYGTYNDQASLLGQQMSQRQAADQAGIGNAIGLLGGIGGFFGA